MSDEDIDQSYGEGEEGFDEDDEGSDFNDVFDEDAHELDEGDDSLRDSSSTVELREKNRAKEARSVLTSSGIVRVREEKLQRVMDVLMLPEHLAEALLNGFSWNDGDLIERFSDSPESCFKKAGLDPKSLSTANNQTTLTNSADGGKGKEITCTICFDDVADYATIPCGHVFCKDCWRSFLEIEIKEGRSTLKCMNKNCFSFVPGELVRKLCTEVVYNRYVMFANKAFVEKSRMKYCPAPNCSVVVEEPNEVGKQLVCICSCGYRFCYTCNDEAHVPATCEHLKHWKTKQDTESYSWIATNTKACPGCGVSTEKHDGCFQMTCRMCKHQWCWLCSDDWITHKDHFACSKYKETKLTNTPEWKGDSKKDAQRKALDRYLHYYNRYMEHLNSLKLEDVTRKKARDMVKELPLEEAYLAPAVEEAITRLVECRRTLGWTYVRAYYEEDAAKRDLFEFQQSSLEMVTERISRALEPTTAKLNKAKLNELRALAKVASSSLEKLFLSN